jgi:hypothetical protein
MEPGIHIAVFRSVMCTGEMTSAYKILIGKPEGRQTYMGGEY